MVHALGILISFGILASNGKIIEFDGDALGRVPPGWTVTMTDRGGAPRWEVRRDTTAPTQPYVLAQVSEAPGLARLPLAILDGVSLRDADVSVRLKPVAGREDQGGGLVWRYRDPNNYYLVRANALNHSVAVYKVQNGRRTPILPGVSHDIPMNGWTILKVAARGNRFQIYLDHHRILEGVDNTFAQGKVGLCTVADSVMYFDDFRVYPK